MISRIYWGVFGLTIVLLLGVNIYFFLAPKPVVGSQTTTPVPRPALPFVPPRSQDRQGELEAMHNSIVLQMTRVAKGDAYAEELARKFASQTQPATLGPGGATHLPLDSEPTAELFAKTPLLLIGPNQKQYLQGKVHSAFSYKDERFYFIQLERWSKWFLGVVALHEAVHWDDQQTGREKKSKMFSNEWLDGELRAYDVEIAAIDHHTNGGFTRTLREASSTSSLLKPERHQGFLELTAEAYRMLVETAFGDRPGSRQEDLHRAGAVQIAFYLMQTDGSPQARRQALRVVYSKMRR